MRRGAEHIEADLYDEAIAVDDDEEGSELSTPATSEEGSPASSPKRSPQARHAQKPHPMASDAPGASRSQPKPQQMAQPSRRRGTSPPPGGSDSDSSAGSEEEASTSSDSEDGGQGDSRKGAQPAGAYNADDFKNLGVSAEVEELFDCITRYQPHAIELETFLKPFIPELYPSIGEVDAFLKMPRPDNEPSTLGLTRLDEPTLNPSDPSILDMKLMSLCKHQDLQPMDVRSIENAEKNPKEIENWVRRIDDLNRSKPAPTVHYSRRMPDIETLMQLWPADFEEVLQQNGLPDLAELDLELPEYVRIFASILDVPVHNQLTETLHVIFSLYTEFKANQHFSKTDNAANFGLPADPHSFGGPVQDFSRAHGAVPQPMGTMAFGPSTESIAPSRCPSPAGGRRMPGF